MGNSNIYLSAAADQFYTNEQLMNKAVELIRA